MMRLLEGFTDEARRGCRLTGPATRSLIAFGVLYAVTLMAPGKAAASEIIYLKGGEEVGPVDILKEDDDSIKVQDARGKITNINKGRIDVRTKVDDKRAYNGPAIQEETAEVPKKDEPKKADPPKIEPPKPKPTNDPVNAYKGDMPMKFLLTDNPDIRGAMSALDELLAKDALPPKGDEPRDYLAAARDARASGDWDLAILDIYRQEQEDNRFDSDARFAALEAMKAGSIIGMMRDCLRQYKDKIDLKDLGDKADEYLNNANDTLRRQQKSKTDPAYRPVYDTVSAIHQAADDLVRKGKEGGGIGGRAASGGSSGSGQSSGPVVSAGIDPNQLLIQLYQNGGGQTQAEKAAAIRAGAALLDKSGRTSKAP